MLQIEPHPLSALRAFVTNFPKPLGKLSSPASLQAFLSFDAAVPIHVENNDRQNIYQAGRSLLRHGGFKPAGRSKPAAEYLLKAALAAGLQSINSAVDACNVVSLHSALSISVVDLERMTQPLRVAVAGPGMSYVFNESGQVIDLGGLLCLFDADGPCANAVKDAQRTKTNDETVRTLTLIWGNRAWADHAAETEKWHRDLLKGYGAETLDVT